MKAQALTPIKKPPKTYEFISIDTEGTGAVGDFRLAVCYDANGPHVFYKPSVLKSWLFSRANLGKRIVAANLEYDYAVAFQPFRGHFNILLSNRRWMKATYYDNDRHAWTAFDIQRVVPLSVAAMGENIGIPKLATPPELIQDREYHPEPWTCDLHHRTFCIECYCARDAEVTYKFALVYQQALNELGGELKLTAASTAMDLYRRKFLTDEIPPTTPDHNDLGRSAYYGGRVEVFRLGTSKDVKVYDFNSLYPSVMRDIEVADPSSYRRVDCPSTVSRYMDKVGQFFGSVEVPDTFIGLLPYRTDSRLYFPTGVISGSWTISEVRQALEHGARLRSCDAILYATRTISPFRNYVDTLYSYRKSPIYKDNPVRLAAKLLLNSLYGKFAQHAGDGLQTLEVPPAKYKLSDYRGSEPVEIAGREMFLKDAVQVSQPAHIHVLWAAEITTQARLKLLSAILPIDDGMIYCDTDSIHTKGKLPVSDDLGALKVEHDFGRAVYFAPKEYGGQERTGEFIHRAKGIPPAYRSFFLKNGYANFRQPIHTLTAIRRGKRIAEWVPVEKHRRSEAMNRDHKHLDDFNRHSLLTYPFPVEEL